MREIIRFIILILAFAAFLACQKTSLPKSQLTPPIKSIAVDTPVPIEAVYYLCPMNIPDYIPHKDSLIVKFIPPHSFEMTMHISTCFNVIYDSCTIYKGDSRMFYHNRNDSLFFGGLQGKRYQVYCNYFLHTPSAPIINTIQNLIMNNDTLKFDLDYEYLISLDGKTDCRYGPRYLSFVKAK